MSKEELKQEAEEYSQKTCGYIRVEIVQAFLAGAEPREKRIAELEAQIKKMKCCSNCKFKNEFDDADVKSERCIGCCPENDNWEIK